MYIGYNTSRIIFLSVTLFVSDLRTIRATGLRQDASRVVRPAGGASRRVAPECDEFTARPRHAPIYPIPPRVPSVPSADFAAIEVQFNPSRRKASDGPGDQLSTYLRRCDIDFRAVRSRRVYIVIYRPRLIDSSITVMADGWTARRRLLRLRKVRSAECGGSLKR
ncbi:hypothetical protein DBV15_07901 [Temnothorax longispinosus]|uniref:Uncharacterized protein n=1 Tax=Temnothorax longispinosus TaxID=300112 RepID=A0A4S2KD58_9HYME|nr:hypothetical protein DBV15_07901 [Temnothorax longispinosus]